MFLDTVNHILTLYLVFPAVLFIGLYFTLKLNFFQFTQLKKSFTCIRDQGKGDTGTISRFGAISAVLAGNFGTGNISGMAIALTTGGPGALFWMWVMVALASIIQYASCLLSIKYREVNENGEYVGGPMYYLKALGLKKLAISFSVFTLMGALSVGNFAQVNSMILPLKAKEIDPLLPSLGIALAIGLVILGGIKRLSSFAGAVVPLKAAFYLTGAFYIILTRIVDTPQAFYLIFQEAFALKAAAGGALGAAVFKGITVGFDRGLFATDAGTGIVPILQAGARTNNPVLDGIATLITPVLVMIVCTATALVLILTGAYKVNGLESTTQVTYAFHQGMGPLGEVVVVVALILFAYTTILAWSYCGERAAAYLFGEKSILYYRIFYVALIPVGAFLNVNFIWGLADLSITLMLLSNLVGVFLLREFVIEKSLDYLAVSQKVKTI